MPAPATSASAREATDRTPVAPYPRAETRPLNAVRRTAETSPLIDERRRRWAPYLTGVASQQAPVATRFVPVLTRDEPIDDPSHDPDVAWPATLYPSGFRQQVLLHCGTEPAASETEEGMHPDSVVYQLCRGRDLTTETEGWSSQRRLRLALTCNVLSLYRATVQMLGRYGRSAERDAHLTYEIARAAYQIGGAPRALEAFGALSSASCPSLPIRLNAASRLIAHYARSPGNDLDVCGRWVEVTTAMLPDRQATGPADFATGLAVSRVHRAVALYASRRRDAAWVTDTLVAATEANRATGQLVDGELRGLESAQNERLILEAALKAYAASGGRVDPLGASAAADRLGAIDPWDPYTRLTIGDACWVLGDDDRALESYDVAVRMGTLVGAHAAHRGAVLLARTGRLGEAKVWRARAVELDPAAADAELPGG
jgi:hypothetical protein